MHLPVGRGRQRSQEKITERRTAVRTTAFPPTDHIIAIGNEIGSTPGIEARKRFAEIGHENLDVGMALAWRVERIPRSMSGAASSSTMPRLQVLPQKSVNQRPTMALLSSSLDMMVLLLRSRLAERCETPLP